MRRIRSLAACLGLAAALAVPAAGQAEDGSGGWWLVRFDGGITQADRDAVEAAGGRGIQYYPPNSYLTWLDGSQATAVRAVPSVSAVDALAAASKVDPSLGDGADVRPLSVTVYAPARNDVFSALSSQFRADRGYTASSDGSLHDLFVLAPTNAAPSIAALPEVLYVGPATPGIAPLDEVSSQIQAGNYTGTAVSPGYEGWLAARGLDGSGVRVSVVDSGVDPHPDLLARIVAQVEYGLVPVVGEPIDSLGHGTHVAGIVAGDANGLNPVTRVRDANGFLYGMGVAPKAQLVDQNALATTASFALCGTQFWPPPYGWEKLATDALANGANVWNASWWSCENRTGDYIETSRTFDRLARDANSSAAGLQPFTFVFAAGNFGPGARTVASPGTSKNVISVGATTNARGTGNLNNVEGFSSRGPAADGRILPTIAAPGGNIVSTRSYAGALCNVPPNADTLGLYATCSGTSMASPHVAGAVALIKQWWRRDNGGADPSPAMTKALLVNSATDMGTADIPNGNEGWGRVNLGTLFNPGTTRGFVDQTVVLTDPGAVATYRIAPADASKPVKVTLAWTDPPGAAGANPALVNDLDLRLTSIGGVTYNGNRFMSGWSISGGAPNVRDNLENVFLKTPEAEYTVTVGASNLPGDGSPGVGDETDQDFALVLSNAVLLG